MGGCKMISWIYHNLQCGLKYYNRIRKHRGEDPRGEF